MSNRGVLLLILVMVVVSLVQWHPKEPTGYELAMAMFESTEQIQNLTYTITKQERIEGNVVKQVSFTRMREQPYSVYLRQAYPNDGLEILYVDGANNNKALINPNGFPWLNIRLNPNEGIMRNNQHHTIFQSGFDHVVAILRFLCHKYRDNIDQMVIYNGVVEQNGRSGHLITFNNPFFDFVEYQVLEGENIERIADKFRLSAYMILENNPGIKDYDDIAVGQTINIPNDYSPKLNLVIDAIDFVPLKMEVFDDKGLYECYEYSNIKINTQIDTLEFTEGYKLYDF